MRRLPAVVTAAVLVAGLAACGGPGESASPRSGEASCADLLHRDGHYFTTWSLRHHMDKARLGPRFTVVRKDCADTGGTPAPDQKMTVRRIKGISPDQAFYRPSVGHWHMIYVLGDGSAAYYENWRRLPARVLALVRHPPAHPHQ
jgi:hypothetical protein